MNTIKILAVDQARHGAWAMFNYESKELIGHGTWSFDNKKYTFPQAVRKIEVLIENIMNTQGIDAVFYEDIQLRVNAQGFKRLAQLQGVLINLAEKNEYLYDLVQPSQWQNYCMARGRSEKEIKAKVKQLESATHKKQSKVLSIQAVNDLFGIETENDNLADACCIGSYVVNNIPIKIKEKTL